VNIFSNLFLLSATISLTLQVIVLLLLVYGYSLKVKSQFLWHGRVMTAAVFLHLGVILSVMVPSLVLALIPVVILPHALSLASVVTLLHVPLGVTALSLGLWLVFSWRFRGGLTGCFTRKKFMLATLTVWSTALSLGIALYFILYWSTLIG